MLKKFRVLQLWPWRVTMRHAGVSGAGRRHTGMADRDREAQKGGSGTWPRRLTVRRAGGGASAATRGRQIQAQEA